VESAQKHETSRVQCTAPFGEY